MKSNYIDMIHGGGEAGWQDACCVRRRYVGDKEGRSGMFRPACLEKSRGLRQNPDAGKKSITRKPRMKNFKRKSMCLALAAGISASGMALAGL